MVMVTVTLLLSRLPVPEMLTEPVKVLLLVVLTVLVGVVDWLTESTAVPLMVGKILEVRLGHCHALSGIGASTGRLAGCSSPGAGH